VVYTGSDGHIYELSSAWNAHVWSAVDLTALSGAPAADLDPKSYARSDGLDAVVYRATDQHVHELSRHDDQWVEVDVSDAAGAPPAAARPAPFVRNDNINAIAYRATDGRLYELSWQDGAWNKTVIYDSSP